MLTVFFIAIYMVAFLYERRASSLLFVCICAEFIGWSPLFTWSNSIEYGMLMHMMWGILYATYVLTSLPRGKLLLTCGAMILLQFIMSVDCRECEGNETILFILYKYIVTIIHCCIVSTFISKRRTIDIMGAIASVFRVVSTNYGFNVGFWYNTHISSKT